MQEIDALEAARLLTESPQNTTLLDVREHAELDLASVSGALHIPMGETPERLAELEAYKNPDHLIICMCHLGGRSAQVAGYLAAQGFRTANLSGGIAAWSATVDPDVPAY